MKFSKPHIAVCVLVLLILACSLLTQPALAQTYTVLYTFTGNPDGNGPSSGLLRVAAQPFAADTYGTTGVGGAYGAGSIFKLSATGQESVLHSFSGGADGGYPQANGGLIRDHAGNLYGVTNAGGTYGAGVIFRLDPSGNETLLHAFTGGADGGSSFSGLLRDAAGNFYGTTYFSVTGGGTVFKLSPGRPLKNLYAFSGNADGGGPSGDLLLDAAGNIYGVGTFGGTFNEGVIFKVTPSGQESVLYNFTGGADGGIPVGLSTDASGNLYGTNQSGGSQDMGVVFSLATDGTYTVLHPFSGASDGGVPTASLVGDGAGNLYGTTLFGGDYGGGVVFKVTTGGAFTVLYTFTGGADGAGPYSNDLIWSPPGVLYGTAASGGSFSGPDCAQYGCGVLFSLTTGR